VGISEPGITRPVVYLAGPLFSEGERSFNREIARILAPRFEVFLPQESGHLLSDLLSHGIKPHDAARAIFGVDKGAIERADIVLILLDGRSVDEGAAFELGMAYAWGKICLGLQTDSRRLQHSLNNPMLECAVTHIFASLPELEAWVTTPRPTKASCEFRRKS
jgi:nucleoside 2-deoxyribosyltransferase